MGLEEEREVNFSEYKVLYRIPLCKVNYVLLIKNAKRSFPRLAFFYGIIYFMEQKDIDYQCFMIHIDGVI